MASNIAFVAYSQINGYPEIEEITHAKATHGARCCLGPHLRAASFALSRPARVFVYSRCRFRLGSAARIAATAVALLMDILEAMPAGRGVSIIPENAELTTVQAAAILNVSRPFSH